MGEHRASVEWHRVGTAFDYKTYSRAHVMRFEGGIEVAGNAAPGNVPATAPHAPGVDPEQSFVAALSACHMLWFLHLALEAGWTVDSYADETVGTLAKNAAGKMAMTQVILRPAVAFGGKAPTSEQLAALHHKAHERCYIANSVTAEVLIEPR